MDTAEHTFRKRAPHKRGPGRNNKNKLYRTYGGMIQRCTNTNDLGYKYWGGRGIKCLWKTYDDFREDMEESFLEHNKKHGGRFTTLDRIDNDGHYCKENCRWATPKEQRVNQRKTDRRKKWKIIEEN